MIAHHTPFTALPPTPPLAPASDAAAAGSGVHPGTARADFSCPSDDMQERIDWICTHVIGKTVVDAGCAEAVMPVQLAREGYKVVALNMSGKFIEDASLRLAGEPEEVRKKVHFLRGSLASNSLRKLRPAARTILIGDAHLVQQSRIEAAARFLGKNGRLVATIPVGMPAAAHGRPLFSVLDPLRLIGEHFDIVEMEVVGRWLGIAADSRSDARPASAPWLSREQKQKLESVFRHIECSLRDELAQATRKLEDAERACRAASGRISDAEHRIIREEADRWAAEQALERMRDDYEKALVRLRDEHSALQRDAIRLRDETDTLRRELARLREQGKAHVATAGEAENRCRQLEGELDFVRAQLTGSSRTSRVTVEQAAALREQLSREEECRRAAEEQVSRTAAELAQLRLRLQEETGALEQRIRLLSEQGPSREAMLQSMQAELARLSAECEPVRKMLEEANGKYRAATGQVSALKQRIAEEEASRHAAERLLNETQAQLKQVSALKERIAEEEASRRTAEQLLNETQVQLNQANLKYRKVTAEDLPGLKAKLEQQYSLARRQQHQLEQLRLEAQRASKGLADASGKLALLDRQKAAAEERVVATRASLSFQLGYLLIHGFKSFRGVIGLPQALWGWRAEALKRRRQKMQRSAVPKAASKAAPRAPRQAPAPAAATPVADAQPSDAGDVWQQLRQLRVACIMDEFSFGSFRNECVLQQLTPDGWEAELAEFRPQLLFVESAWRGVNDLWGSKVSHTGTQLQAIVAWCRARNIPTVFWNKEDPVHFETFLTTAKLFDHVFTTDIDCIHRYKAALRHDHVYLLPFACQPAVNNPIETYERKDAFCFAGAYYARYPERTRDLGNLVADLARFRPLEIYDRNHGKTDPNYQFPPEYQPYIIGTLPFDQIDKAYKGYRYAINLNSIKQSQSMFARRVFELLASNTITVSNFSRGVRLLLGDLVIATDSGKEMLRQLHALSGDDAQARKHRLAGLRKVMQEHTYAHRLAYVVSRVRHCAPPSGLPRIAVLARVRDRQELQALVRQCQRQRYANCTFHIVLSGAANAPHPVADPRIVLVSEAQAAGRSIGSLVGDAELVAGMIAQDHYGANYLLDIALATQYSSADAIGKGARHALADHAVRLESSEAAYRPITRLPARCAAIRRAHVVKERTGAWLDTLATLQFETANGLAIDEFNYCRDGGGEADHELVSRQVDDLPGLNTGISIDELLARAEGIAPAESGHDDSPVLGGPELARDFGKAPGSAIRMTVEEKTWRIESSLADGKHEYVYATADHSLEELGFTDRMKTYLDVTPGLNIQLAVFFLDAQKQKISHVITYPNRNQEANIPSGTARIRFALRIYAGGSAEIKGLALGHRNLQPSELLTQASHLLLTNHYPSYEDLYRNGFVHSRVRAYRAAGIRCEVFRLRPQQPVSYHEFENVDVMTGPHEVLDRVLASGQYKTVLVHFLDPSMWEVLQRHVERIRMVVWLHGAEIQPWHRRAFNYQTENELTVAKMQSESRTAFWRGLFQRIPANLKFVFVSRHFAEEVMEDMGLRIPEDSYRVIHNPIDVELFRYRSKPAAQRKKVLSVRPFATRMYANDLSARAIELLSSRPWFEEMEFRLIGDGPLFEKTVAPLRRYRNVYIEQRFLQQDEIAALHREYGIFLCPSRMDTQGVSRDEAMASGLVPVTSAAGAIPDFVDDTCAIMTPYEDAKALAAGIERLYLQPEDFLAMSRAAAARVRRQSSMPQIIDAEMELFAGDRNPHAERRETPAMVPQAEHQGVRSPHGSGESTGGTGRLHEVWTEQRGRMYGRRKPVHGLRDADAAHGLVAQLSQVREGVLGFGRRILSMGEAR